VEAQPVEAPPVVAAPVEAPAPAVPVVAEAVRIVELEPVASADAGKVARKHIWSTFLYLDVVLPMIAVLVVLIVLLAWVG
jgi:hypothetical protein